MVAQHRATPISLALASSSATMGEYYTRGYGIGPQQTSPVEPNNTREDIHSATRALSYIYIYIYMWMPKHPSSAPPNFNEAVTYSRKTWRRWQLAQLCCRTDSRHYASMRDAPPPDCIPAPRVGPTMLLRGHDACQIPQPAATHMPAS